MKLLPRTICNLEDVKQLVRSSGSVGANRIEANEPLSKKDLIMRIKISCKEAKESVYWLRLLDAEPNQPAERDLLVREAGGLINIFGAILRNVEDDRKG